MKNKFDLTVISFTKNYINKLFYPISSLQFKPYIFKITQITWVYTLVIISNLFWILSIPIFQFGSLLTAFIGASFIYLNILLLKKYKI